MTIAVLAIGGMRIEAMIAFGLAAFVTATIA